MFKKDDKNLRDQKITDLVWYEYETRLRKNVQELLEPTIKRSLEDRESQDSLSKKYDELVKRVEDLELSTQKTRKRETVFDQIFTRINEIDTSRKEDNAKLQDEVDNLRKTVDIFKSGIQIMDDAIKNNDKMIQKLTMNFEHTTKDLVMYKTGIDTLIEEIQKNIIKNAEDLKAEAMKTEKKFQMKQDLLNEVRAQVNTHEIAINNVKGNITELASKISAFDKNLTENNATLVAFAKHVDSIKALKFKSENLDLQVRTVENYIEKYQPIALQAQVSETLHYCLNAHNRKKLMLYEEKKFNIFNNEVLHDDGNPNLQKKTEKVAEILETTIKRFARGTIAHYYGIKQDMSNNSSSREGSKRDLYSTNRKGLSDDRDSRDDTKRESSVASEDEHNQTERSPKADPKSANNKVKKINVKEVKNESESDDQLDLMIGQKHLDVLRDNIDNLRIILNKKIEDVKRDLSSLIEQVVKDQASLEENCNMMMRNTFSEVEVLLEKIKNEKANQHLELSEYGVKIEKISEYSDKLYACSKKLTETLTPLIETVNGMLVIVSKEEKEKKSILNILQIGISPNPPSLIPEEGKLRTHSSEKKKKAFDMPVLVGNKPQIEEITKKDLEIHIKHGGEILKKSEFLEIIFENFKGCLVFANKARTAPTFQNLIDEFKFGGTKSNTFFAPSTAQRIRTEESPDDKQASLVYLGATRLSSISYKNYKTNEPKTITPQRRNLQVRFPSPDPTEKMNKTFFK